MTTKKIEVNLYQEILNITKPKKRYSVPDLKKCLRKKGVEFSVIGLGGAVIRLVNEKKARISAWCWYHERNIDLVIKEITRLPGA